MNKRKLSPRKTRSLRTKRKLQEKGKIRLSVFRSEKYIYAQLIDNTTQKTLISASEKEIDLPKGQKPTKSEKAKLVGELIAAKAKKRKIETIIFDRNGYKYHGRVKALAEAVRKTGLNF